MHLSLSLTLVLIAEQCSAFSLFPANSIATAHHRTVLAAEASPPSQEKKSLTSADILARSRKAAGVPEEEEEEKGPKLFDEPLIDDMQQVLLTLEKRVNEGPGSISLLEVEEFHATTSRILIDMKEKEAARLSGLSSGSPAAPPAVTAAEAAPELSAPVEIASAKEVEDNDEEGPAFDGAGGFGLARGTTNTWVIPGMDEMSPEEYQAAIQKSVSDRQSQRKEEGQYGNWATNDYMNNLNGQSSGGMLK